jgi:hypothetical protein
MQHRGACNVSVALCVLALCGGCVRWLILTHAAIWLQLAEDRQPLQAIFTLPANYLQHDQVQSKTLIAGSVQQ